MPMSLPPFADPQPAALPSPAEGPVHVPTPEDEAQAASAARRVSRRKFLRGLVRGGAAVTAGTFLYTWRVEPHWVEIVRRPLPIAGLPDALVGKRLVQLSDLHVGPVVDQNYLLRSAERVAAMEPDMLVVTGDFMTCRFDEQVSRALEVVAALPKPPLGRFGVLGNHDFGAMWRQDKAANRLTSGLERLEFQLIRNDVAEAGGLQIVGVDEFMTGHFNPPKALAKLAADRAAICLCHNPDAMDVPAWEGYQGWVLAGHTHGGQCKPPFLPPPRLPVNNRRYVAGEYALDGGRRLYINRGLGYLHRLRFNARPEITEFTLTRAEA
jgi:predicted MPP superfamily phosphohydrolase